MEKTNYQKVLEFCETFGHPVYKNPQYDIWDKSKLVKLRVDLIDEEVKELHEAVENKDFIETIDALADILYVTYGMLCTLGVDGDKAMGLVHNSNMSKICQTEEESQKTVEWYKKEFNEGRLNYDSPKYKFSENGWIVFNETSGKILKSINYFPVKFDTILNKD